MLQQVNIPSDIRTLTIEELIVLAHEIRKEIIETVAANGGHLASSLGAVELTLALHYVFNTPEDKIIWDVGHQTYAHKIITGRKNEFCTLRKSNGLSGFPKREESVYDTFGAGHSSTSISAGSGILEAQHLTGRQSKIISVIGDGSLTAGLAFEGLNWAGDRQKNLIIILNDNEMSISPNVGALSSYLNRIMTGQQVVKLKSRIQAFLKTIPGIGEQMVRITKQAEESFKAFLVPGMLFEEMGFKYIGPLEGNRLDHLIKNFGNIKELSGPILVHIVTKKGKGYRFAEEEPARFHGIGPFDIETGITHAEEETGPAYTSVFGDTMMCLAAENPNIVAITAAMRHGTGLDAFAKKYPERFFDVGIAEQHGVTFAAGLAVEGIVPIVAIYSTFLQRAYDQVLHDVCLQNLPVVFALDRGGIVGDDGPTHHGLFDFSYLRSIPNIVVMAPKDENELRHMLKTAVYCGKPVSIRYPRGKGVGVPFDEKLQIIDLGRGETLRSGNDLAIIAIGSMVYPALQAAEALSAKGIEVTVINSRFVKPMDEDLICESAERTKKIITVEENVLMGGFGSAALELFARRGIVPEAVECLGIGDCFVEQGSQEELRKRYGIDAAGIIRSASNMMGLRSE
ncbi:MAG: 1-deoxy-D-xylulose-5-phosphate synthase [Syntrophales bacterium]|jgi:1-deoxy-D-xylulose-5-phosphate synthase|nr:1-deoxy-D-xylulose-5-phosphate synthase [Syntrophales bacterium]MDY0043380.1 1-deoxy-D-xylulose-5-phosphate synthase [Syntrophales bacterium]